jgi:hypothetical protein
VDLCIDKVVITREMTFPSYSAPVSSCIIITVSMHAVAGYSTFAFLLLSFLLLLRVKLLQSSLLLLVAGFTTVACIPAVDGHFCCCLRPFTLVPDVLTVAGLPALVVSPVLFCVPAVAFIPACC